MKSSISSGSRVSSKLVAIQVVQIDEVLFHCGKAINRARLWQPEAQIVRDAVPTIGEIMAAFSKMSDPSTELNADQITQVNTHYTHSVRTDLY